jgi:hypothetical protein
MIAPRVAVDNATKVKNIILIGTIAQNLRDLIYFQYVYLPIVYADKVLDHNHNGLISIQEEAKDPTFQIISSKVITNSTAITTSTSHLLQSANNINNTRTTQQQLQGGENSINKQNYISIEKDLKPLLIKRIESLTTENPNCVDLEGCPTYVKSHFALGSTLSMIGNVSSNTGILILQGEDDIQAPVQQAFMLQQRLTEVNHPDHMLITYPGLGHQLSPAIGYFPGSEMFLQKPGPTEDYALVDLYSWLETHSGFTSPTTISNTMSPSSFSNFTAHR